MGFMRVNLHNTRDRLAGVDWGFTNPGVIVTGLVDGDSRIYVVNQVYRTQQTIDWWVAQGKRVKAEFGVRTFVCDPSEPGHIEEFKRAGLNAVKANNDVRIGIQAVQQRLRVADDGKPRLMFLADCIESVDGSLREAGRPSRIEEEFETYVWDIKANRRLGEEPLKENDHGLDALRYLVMHIDSPKGRGWGF